MAQTTEFTTEATAWNEKRKAITTMETHGDKVTLTFGRHVVVVTCPATPTDSYILDVRDRRPTWLDDVNIYCLEKRPSPTKLLNVISKQIASTKETDETMVKLEESVTTDRDLGFDFERYKKAKELEALIATSPGGLGAQGDVVQRRQLFGHLVVGKIIVNEFLRLWDQSRAPRSAYKIDLVDNNIYRWRVRFNRFGRRDLTESLAEVNGRYGYDAIELDVTFHETLYPNYPPTVKVLRPRLSDSLMHRIANTRMIQLDYWLPTRTMSFILQKLHQILERHAKVTVETEMNDRTKYPVGAFLPIETHLLDLASFVEVEGVEDVDDEKYEKVFAQSQKAPSRLRPDGTVWKAGTGYGHGGTPTWDVTTYLKSVAERDRQAQTILNKIVIDIQETRSPKVVYDALHHSVLMGYLRSLLDGTTLLEMRKHLPLYQMVFTLLGNLANEDAIYLLGSKGGAGSASASSASAKSLYEIIGDLDTLARTARKYMGETEPDDLIGTVTNIASMIKQCHDSALEAQQIRAQRQRQEETQAKTEAEIYIKAMTALRDSDRDFKLVNTNFHYQDTLVTNRATRPPREQIKRISDEISTFGSLPITYDAIIISRPDATYPTAIRTLMTGPVNTPYEAGCFLFDTYLHPQFPASAPHVWFLNTGAKRMNPNLYDSGKVCLSILGTWDGDASESWNPALSTLITIYKSIQSLILIEQPFFNEPGYESRFRGASGIQQSKKYNDNIRLFTMQHAMLDLITAPSMYPQFEDVIRTHFKLKKNRVIAVCDKWVSEAPATLRATYTSVYERIKTAIQTL